MKLFIKISLFFISINHFALAQTDVPCIHTNIHTGDNNKMYVAINGQRVYEKEKPVQYNLEKMKGSPKGTDNGIAFDFNDSGFNGTLYYGFIVYGDSDYPTPVFFKKPAKIKEGKSEIDVRNTLEGVYDIVGWEETGKGTIGYRVINEEGMMLYDGKVAFEGTGPFKVSLTIIEGPFVNLVSPHGAVISFKTNFEIAAQVEVENKIFTDQKPTTNHEIELTGLESNKNYQYRVICDENVLSFAFKTAPEPGSRTQYVFSYSSDSRSGPGGGERDLYGVNFYIMRKIMALNAFRKVSFMQFTGDLINGYLTDAGEMDLQYANWKRAVEPFSHYIPVYTGMGNHEALIHNFGDLSPVSKTSYRIDRFPYQKESSEILFAENFVNPVNGPHSEDGAYYDPDLQKEDFPTYSENVFYYTYDNIAIVVMNSDYWYAPSTTKISHTSGGVHGYIMDQQLKWVKTVIAELEENDAIDHVFITQHTPFFPNGGHVIDDMWYNGNNKVRTYVAGKPLHKGIIERRDELLDLFVNKSKKVVAFLTGDEHNYCRLELHEETEIYPPLYEGKKIKISRKIYQINNGAAGAPYYAQEKTPWFSDVKVFTTQHVLVFFHINGNSVFMEVMNPVTLEEVDCLKLR